MDWIITSTDGRSTPREELGGKAAALREAAKAGLPVPAWFVVSPGAFRASLAADQKKARTYYQKLLALTQQADTPRPEISEAKKFLAMAALHKKSLR